MSFEVRQEPAITVMGIHGRVSNSEPHLIGDLWRRFNAMGKEAAIAARLSDENYCVYCEYAGDWTLPFTVVIGCAVPHDSEVPDEMKKIYIAAGRFAVLLPTGELPQSVFDAWSEVWNSSLDRRYEADYDVYGDRNSLNGASVHVGVR